MLGAGLREGEVCLVEMELGRVEEGVKVGAGELEGEDVALEGVG